MFHILKVHQKEIKNAVSLVGFLLNEGNFETFSFWNREIRTKGIMEQKLVPNLSN
jgi:hypothetical protein